MADNVHDDDGFTLIELLAVIVIIGILAVIAFPAFLGQKSKGQRAALRSDLRNVSSAQESYFVDNGTYTTDEAALADEGFQRSPDVSELEINVYTADGAAAFCAHATHLGSGAEAWFSSYTGSISEVVPDVASCPA